jgi:hypothetical protein
LTTKPRDHDDYPLIPGTCGSGVLEAAIPDRPLNLPFSDCCQAHDNCYGDKSCSAPPKDDSEFYYCMEAVCENYPPPLKWLCIGIAKTYLAGVFWRGQKPFNEARGITPPPPPPPPTPEEYAFESQENYGERGP